MAFNTHVPAVSIVTENPDTEHTPAVDDDKATGRFESVDAAIVNGDAEYNRSAGAKKLIV